MLKLSDLQIGNVLHEKAFCKFEVGPRGGITEHHYKWEITNIKTWKRNPDRFEIVLHRGLKQWWHVEYQSVLDNEVICFPENCPAAQKSIKHFEGENGTAN